MTIDDFDVNEISNKLAVREEADNAPTLEVAHDDGHNDIVPHGDTFSPPSWHDDIAGLNHDDGHNDFVFDDCCFDDGPLNKEV